jgi:CheY-like chemotaxis protein/HPt (histidine-containing phosphotransfer) domain-containing protein
MPEMDGFMFAERVRGESDLAQPIILMLTSGAQSGDIDRCRTLGIAAHLRKPIRQLELLEAIQRVVGDHAPSSRAVPQVEAPEKRLPARLRILLAEDNVVNQRLAIRLLEKSGHVVHVVDNGKLAVEAIAAREFDVVLMDVQMPEMGGFEATALIRRYEAGGGRHTPIVAMTAHAMTGDREKCLSAGMDAYISKPVSQKELADVLQSVAPTSPNVQEPASFLTLDIVTEREAILRRIGGDDDLLRELAETFILNAKDLVIQIRAAATAQDFSAVSRAAHAYKGSAIIFGLAPLVDVAAKLEATGAQGGRSEVAALVRELESQTIHACDFLRTLVEEMPCVS